MNKKIIYFLPPVLITVLILILSTVFTLPLQLQNVDYLDKIEHLFAYFIMSSSFFWAFSKTGIASKKIIGWTAVLCVIYGGILEVFQYAFFENRYFEWLDMGANCTGVVLGYLLHTLFTKKSRR